MEFIILGLLLHTDMTIYDINSSFKSGLSLIYSSSYGSLQNAIKKLLKNRQIDFSEKVENGRNKKIYSILPAGKQSFLEWMHSEISENKLETNMLIKVYFLDLIEQKADKLSILEDIIEKVTIITEQIKQLQYGLNESLDEADKTLARYPLKTLDYGVMAHQVGLDWIQKVYQETKQN